MKRPDRDFITLESAGGADFSIVVDRATQYEVTCDLTAPSTARFELGDDGTWEDVRAALAIGSRFTVCVNAAPRLTGRLLTRNLAVSSDAGATVQVVVRTRLADAMFTAVDPKIGVRNTTVKDMVLAAFKRMGLTEADFIFRADVARDLITGRRSGQRDRAAGLRYQIAQEERSANPDTVVIDALNSQIAEATSHPVDPALTDLQLDEARPHPPESVYAFVDRHLSRFGLIMWDGADGRIVIGEPDDSQQPLGSLTARRDPIAARNNNILSATKTEDYEEVPAHLWVYGVGGGKDQSKARVKFMEVDPTLAGVDPSMDRAVVIIDESIRTQEQAAARARREMMKRSMARDAWQIELDGLTYWSGSEIIPYAIDTMWDIQVDVAGLSSGAYLVRQCTLRGNASDGHTTSLACVGRGVWRI